jgi:Fur family peroxide stress response transcriptional regulator
MTEKATYSQFEEACHEHGLRLTQQRFEVFRALLGQKEHLSAEQVTRRVRRKMPNISVDTVYRTLDTFARTGVVNKFLGPDGAFRYDSNPDEHHHAVCVMCGRIEDFDWPEFDRMKVPHDAAGLGPIESKHVEIKVVCKACLAAARNKRGTRRK